MAKKDNNVNQIETDIKAVAKAVGASMKRQGHAVPHSVILNAVSASLNRRDWHKLKVAVSGNPPVVQGLPDASSSPFDKLWQHLSDQDKFWAAIAGAQGVQFVYTPEGWASKVVISGKAVTDMHRSETLAAAARVAMSTYNLERSLSANLFRGSETLGGALYNLVGREGSFTHFNQKMERSAAKLTYPVNARARIQMGGVEIEIAAYGISKDNWYFPSGGERELWDQVVGSVDFRQILGFPAQNKEPGSGVSAKFWSDDHLHEVTFDASPALEASHDDHLERILWLGASDNDAVDAIALYMHELNTEVAAGLDHVWHMRDHGQEMGFGCRLDIRQFREWMDSNRRVVLARWFCDEEGVKLNTRTSNSGDTFYDWDYVPTPRGSEAKGWDFPTEEAALLDAYEKLGRQKGFLDRV